MAIKYPKFSKALAAFKTKPTINPAKRQSCFSKLLWQYKSVTIKNVTGTSDGAALKEPNPDAKEKIYVQIL